jgi:hypothetical protein
MAGRTHGSFTEAMQELRKRPEASQMPQVKRKLDPEVASIPARTVAREVRALLRKR